MKLNKWLIMGLIITLLGLGIMLACGDDDDDDDNDTSADDDSADDDAADDDAADDDVADDDSGDDDDDDASPIPGSIGGTVQDFLSENPLAGTAVEAFQANGQPFDPAVTGVSDSSGYVLLELPADYTETTVGIKTSRDNYKVTIQFGFLVGSADETFLCISNTVFGLMAGSTGVTPDPLKGHAAGAVYWGNPADETPIGCAEVTLDPASGQVFYAGGILGLPDTSRNITTPGDPQNGEGTDANPNKGKGVFVGVNVDPTTTGVTLTANADGNEESSFLPIVLADSVLIQNIYYDKGEYASNPTGSWCTE